MKSNYLFAEETFCIGFCRPNSKFLDKYYLLGNDIGFFKNLMCYIAEEANISTKIPNSKIEK